MRNFMWFLNSALALSCMFLMGLYVWLLVLILVNGGSGADAITQIVYSVDGWLHAIFG